MTTSGLGVWSNNIHFKKIYDEDNNLITKYFEEIEIKEVVWECGSSKSLSPYRFNLVSLRNLGTF